MLQIIYDNPWVLPATVGATFGCMVPIIGIITEHQRKIRQAELDYELKRDLLSQGRGPDEIERVLEMSSERRPWWAKQTH